MTVTCKCHSVHARDCLLVYSRFENFCQIMETIDVTVDIDSGVGSAEATPVNLEQNPIVEETVQALELETSKPKTIIMTTTSKPAQIADADDDLVRFFQCIHKFFALFSNIAT